MENFSTLRSWCLLVLPAAMAQAGETASPPSYERLLPQWLTGIIAVSAFLLLTFIGFLAKKIWCENSNRSRRNSLEPTRENDCTSELYDTRLSVLRNNAAVESENKDYETSLEGFRNNQTEKSGNQDYETSLEVLRNKRTEESGNQDYETSLEVLRNKQTGKSGSQEYQTSLDVLRNKGNVEPENHDYETSLEVLRSKTGRNAFENLGMDDIEDKSTAM